MARIRTVKPEFWQSESLSSLEPMTRLLAIGLLNHADDEGYFRATPALIRAAVFPFDDSANIPRMLQDLSGAGYLQLGTAQDGRQYGWIVKFLKHQRVDKPKTSEIKGLCDFQEHSENNLGTIQDASKGERKGKERNKEGKGKENNGADAPDFSLWFSELWDSWPTGFGEKGSRKNAEAVFRKIGPDSTLFALMTDALNRQTQHKVACARDGQFCPNFPHVERWLKNQRWQDEISKRPVKQCPVDRAEAAAEAAFGPSLNGSIEGDFDRIDEDGPLSEPIAGSIPHLGGRIE